ncbi:alpha/beta hydrolase family protein [Streptomyces sp. Je 1-79]|uniref:alpha/beta hydrolase family protein n=1 Tax=Streptomyces sp. Je 1-79 TaxID=2943847 RepID=UPI0021A34C51|nr:alpha/beta hydrolase family protein [Streptomyces sp. Je 1-79]MCT4352868.1 alpha/beta hydrolase family protein [Streptomyces sp. Je 1-79]
MRRYTRTLVAAALTTTVVAGTAGWASGHAQQAVTGAPVGAEAWRADGLPDPERTSPADIAAFFRGLSPARQQELLRAHPSVVGNLDGVPPKLRYEANARTLGPEYAGRQVLAVDPRGRGQIALVDGDLTTAEHVAVVVPGSDIDAGNVRPLTDMADALRRAVDSRTTGGRTADSRTTDRHTAGGRTAVIAWAGYTTPVGVGVDAATGELAEAGAERLTRLTDGLAAVGAPAPSLFCHSYGSVVCGLAAHDLKVKDLVVFGSPGMRAANVGELRTSARVWAAKDPSDWIDRIPNVRFAGLGHGADPTDPEFGARRVPADDAHGHDGYFAPGTQSLRTFAAIAQGDVR